jgi:hypothetical protein
MMRRRSHFLVVAACLALVGALMAATPAGAVQPFGPVVTVTQPGCSFGAVSGDTVVGSDGKVRGFVEFEGGGCGTGRVIHYVEGAGGSWTSTPSPYRGIVLGVAWDGTATYLLYAANDGIRITKRTAAGFTAGRRLSSRGLGGAVVPSGDVVAAGGNWWAVWTEQVGPGGEFAQTDLFQALTLGQGHFHNGIGRQRITANPLWDGDPSLTMAPGGGSAGQVVLAWTRDDGPRGERRRSASPRPPSTAAGSRGPGGTRTRPARRTCSPTVRRCSSPTRWATTSSTPSTRRPGSSATAT